jgi:hypothetical protein
MIGLVDPTIVTERDEIDYAPRPTNPSKLRVVLVENTKKNSEAVLRQLAADLKSAHGIEMEVLLHKPQRGPFTDAQLRDIRGKADFVISGVGD